ncbi:hypothetical protein OAory_01052850 [Aspergillus oryzae]|uniref:FAD dependent oxidoreductase domain-containing protein n=1 Tax=Aspergillus oryzae TaxID=5062 RepID=A0A1S9D5S0_ASPOZ|nr:hypothetical protein OAory_01052850 [Aspergillus oryzae]
MDVTIIGSSVISLLSALVLTHAQYKVTIIASDLPGDQNQDWASPWYAYLTRTRRFIRKQVHSIEEAKHIVKRDMPVHASGLGAAQLAGDKDVLPALTKGSTKDIVAFRPGRKGGYRIEAEGNVVHAYGFGSLVYVYSYAALKSMVPVIPAVKGHAFEKPLSSACCLSPTRDIQDPHNQHVTMVLSQVPKRFSAFPPPNMSNARTHTKIAGTPDYDDPIFWDTKFATGQDVGEWLNRPRKRPTSFGR